MNLFGRSPFLLFRMKLGLANRRLVAALALLSPIPIALLYFAFHRPEPGKMITLWDVYKVDPYIKDAVALQSMSREAALNKLHEMAKEEDLQSNSRNAILGPPEVVILCRMLFVPRSGSGFRVPMLGGPGFLGGTTFADWPLEPIELVDGVPFLIVTDYTLSGFAEPADDYLFYCVTNCDWSSGRYRVKTSQEKRDALKMLLSSPKWKTPIDAYWLKPLAAQIE